MNLLRKVGSYMRDRVYRFRLTPDGAEYIRMSEGEQVAIPYHLRFVLPFICRNNRMPWLIATWGGVAVSTVCVAILADQRGLTIAQSVVASLLFLGLPSTRVLMRVPVLVDAAGMACALVAAVLWPVNPWASVAVATLGAGVSEKTPIWAALFAWQPLLLVGLVVPLVRWLGWQAGPIRPNAVALAEKEFELHSHLKHRAQVWRDPNSVVLPWGACLFALMVPDLWWMAALAVAMGQLAVAYDTVRLIQMAAPAVCIAAASAISIEYALPILVAHWTNPWMGEGL